ncbi:MAG TPA: sigma 54-interacting transcriptional regulator [Polyangiales bacterium]|nr:sigma 54-interacting transcriptional regulator [Polyangiales bacterium]
MEGPERFGELVGRVGSMRQLFARAAQLAEGDASVLICGEAGTGKDLLARSLHVSGPRKTQPFIALDCSAVEPAALAGELFGAAARAGALELARGGTLLLDEVTALPLTLQPRLSEAIAQGSFTRDGSEERVRLDVRLIAASKRRPAEELQRGKLLPALHAQISGEAVTMPPLRDRRDDLPLLARTLLARLNEGAGLSLTPDAVAAFALHDWPGNVRELRNVIERALHGLRGGGPGARHLASLWFGYEGQGARDPEQFEPGLSYREQRTRFEDGFEKRYVAWLLERHDGNVSAAARAADMDRKYLYKLAKKHALKSNA